MRIDGPGEVARSRARRHSGVGSLIRLRTVEDRVGDEPARVDDLVTDDIQRLAIAPLDGVVVDMVAAKLVLGEALDVPTVVLVEVGELVVEEHGGIDVCGHVELDDALAGEVVRNAGGTGLVEECVLGSGDGCARV